MIDLTKLRTFLHVAQSLSFSEAATHLHLSQPTVSQHIKVLEGDLGVKLFARVGHDVSLTEAGCLLLPYARKLVRESIEVKHLLAALDTRVVGQLRIACGTTTGKYITPQFAGRFRDRYPGVTVLVMRCVSPQVVPTLFCEEANIGVVSYDACGEGMECQEFFDDRIILIVPADHPWAARQCIEPSELLDMPIILREPTSGTRRALVIQLAKHAITLDDMNVFLEVGATEAIVKVVEAGLGVAFVSRLAADWALDKGSVVEVPVADFELHRMVYMIKPEMHPTSRAVEAFWSFVHHPSNADLLRLAER
ncbi:MAG: LysR family transcriptional regulator [Anaerolineae bacterium]|nr:LysR family transcriptional regulator [Anaerolineae bacterium]